MVARLILLAAFGAYLDAAGQDLLERVRVRMARSLERLPDYTCVETIDRTLRRAADAPEELDRLRVDIAYAGGKELRSWPGEGKFVERRLEDMIRFAGAIGTGDFALHIRNLCRASAAWFSGPIEEHRGDRRGLRWNFKIPKGEIGLQVGTLQEPALVPYHGSFWVDAESLDLLRIQTYADEIPEWTRISAAIGAIDYSRSRIGHSEFLLPVSSELTMTDSNQFVYHNRSQFSGCRQFVGESSISFDDAEPAAAKTSEQRAVILASGLVAETVLETGIDVATAAVGDPIQAVLVRPLRQAKKVIYPQGAKLEGRITRLQRRAVSDGRALRRFYIVGLRFSTLEGGGARSEFQGCLEELWPSGAVYYLPSTRDPFPLEPNRSLAIWEEVFRAIAQPEPGEGVFLAIGKVQRISPKLRLRWRTLPQR